jgi:hypothetical protein
MRTTRRKAQRGDGQNRTVEQRSKQIVEGAVQKDRPLISRHGLFQRPKPSSLYVFRPENLRIFAETLKRPLASYAAKFELGLIHRDGGIMQ